MKTNNSVNTFTVAAAIAFLASDVGKAAVSITVVANGADMVMTASGSLNLAALTFAGGGYTSAGVKATEAWITAGALGTVDFDPCCIVAHMPCSQSKESDRLMKWFSRKAAKARRKRRMD